MQRRWPSCCATSEDRVVARRAGFGAALLRRRGSLMNYSFAKPLDLDNEHEVIRWVDQERDESFVMSAEM